MLTVFGSTVTSKELSEGDSIEIDLGAKIEKNSNYNHHRPPKAFFLQTFNARLGRVLVGPVTTAPHPAEAGMHARIEMVYGVFGVSPGTSH